MECETITWLNNHSGKYELSHSGMSDIVDLKGMFKNYETVNPEILKDEIASLHDVNKNQVVITHGATEAFSMVLFYLRKKYKSFNVNYPEYEMIFKTPEAMAYSPGNEVFVASNPNNPTGVMANLSKNSSVSVIDETFLEFVDSLDNYDYENGFIVNTFTKLYGCGDLRLGYIIAPGPDDAVQLEGFKGLITEDVSIINTSIGYNILKDHDLYVNKAREIINKNHRVLLEKRKNLKFYKNLEPLKTPVSFVDYSKYTEKSSDEVSEELAKDGIIALPARYFGLHGPYLRVCITGNDFPEAYSKLINALEKYKN